MYTAGAVARSSASFGQAPNLTIAMDAVACTSNEARLADCNYLNATAVRSCSHVEDAGVICPRRKQHYKLYDVQHILHNNLLQYSGA